MDLPVEMLTPFTVRPVTPLADNVPDNVGKLPALYKTIGEFTCPIAGLSWV